MSKLLFVVFAICVVETVFGRIAREQQTPAEPNGWVEAINLANETFEALHRSFLNIAGVNTDAELWTKTQDQFKTFDTQIRSSVADITEDTKPLTGKAEELYKAFLSKVTEVADELKAKNPELFSGDIKKLQSVAERNLRVITDETQKLRTKLEAEGQRITPKVEATLKSLYEGAVKTAQDLKTQAESTLNQIQKKN